VFVTVDLCIKVKAYGAVKKESLPTICVPAAPPEEVSVKFYQPIYQSLQMCCVKKPLRGGVQSLLSFKDTCT